MNNDFKRFWAWPDELAQSGILGINRRNVGFIFEHNPRHLYPRVDNKLKTKEICEACGILVPETYGVLQEHSDCRRFLQIIGDRSEFVVKPASGAAGRGIIVVARRAGNTFYTSGDREITWSDLRYHLSTILSGLYSLGGQLDQVIVERRIVSHPLLMSIAVEGTPDVRVVIYRGVPVMAMIRLSTTRSEGRANLHQGAVAAAVDLETGVTYGGVCENRAITHHPDTKQPLTGIEIPSWHELLDAAMRTSDALGMGYVGVDFVIDINMGPVVLEANARPGLSIQLAHGRGMLPRLAFVDSLAEEMRVGQRRWELLSRLAKLSAAPTLGVPSD
ncbi:MAG: alpha-L-glutamate ligase-like protein [Planctomycetes bacterium]|nr:alpha-L-glutamate ligase-like protein [Planctomycetota bacterium]